MPKSAMPGTRGNKEPSSDSAERVPAMIESKVVVPFEAEGPDASRRRAHRDRHRRMSGWPATPPHRVVAEGQTSTAEPSASGRMTPQPSVDGTPDPAPTSSSSRRSSRPRPTTDGSRGDKLNG